MAEKRQRGIFARLWGAIGDEPERSFGPSPICDPPDLQVFGERP
jgi:hypothetical protein